VNDVIVNDVIVNDVIVNRSTCIPTVTRLAIADKMVTY